MRGFWLGRNVFPVYKSRLLMTGSECSADCLRTVVHATDRWFTSQLNAVRVRSSRSERQPIAVADKRLTWVNTSAYGHRRTRRLWLSSFGVVSMLCQRR
jgi:hypothetical protein